MNQTSSTSRRRKFQKPSQPGSSTMWLASGCFLPWLYHSLTMSVSADVVGSHVFFVLVILNAIAFGGVLVREREFASVISALPVGVVHLVVGGFDRMNLIGGAVPACPLVSVLFSVSLHD